VLPQAVPKELVTDDDDEEMGVTFFAGLEALVAPGMTEEEEEAIFTTRFRLPFVSGLTVSVSPSRDLESRLC